MRVKINVKKIGKNRGAIEPVFYEYPEGVDTVEKLLRETVRINLEEFTKRRKRTEVEAVLSGEDIEEQAGTGKISFGIAYDGRTADFENAVKNACQCFEDGIAVIFLEGKRLETLEERIALREDSQLTFVRMTMLAGRMW